MTSSPGRMPSQNRNLPSHCGRHDGAHRPERQGGGRPTYRPTALHQSGCLAAMARIDDLRDQHRADGPLAAKTQSLHGAGHEELAKVMRKAAQKSEYRKPQNRELQNARAPEPVGEHPGSPSANRRSNQCAGGDVAGLRLAHAPEREQRGNDEAVDHEIKAIQPVTQVGCQQRAPFTCRGRLQPHAFFERLAGTQSQAVPARIGQPAAVDGQADAIDECASIRIEQKGDRFGHILGCANRASGTRSTISASL